MSVAEVVPTTAAVSSTSVVSSSLTGTELHSSQQGLLNYQLRLNIEDQLGACDGLRDEVTQALAELQRRWSKATETVLTAVQQYDLEGRFVGAKSLTPESVTKDAKLSLESTFVDEYLQRHDAAPLSAMLSAASGLGPLFRELNDKGALLGRRRDIYAALTSLAAKLCPMGDSGLSGMVEKATDIAFADPLSLLRAELAKSLKTLTASEASLAVAMEERDACVRLEDIPGAELRTSTALTTLKNCLSLISQRRDGCLEAQRTEVPEFIGFVERTAAEFDATLGQLQGQQSGWQGQVASDREALSTFLQVVDERNAEAAVAFDASCQTYRGKAAQLATRQLQCWEEILAVMPRLEAIGESRRQLVAEHLQQVDQERARLAQHQLMLELCSQRQRDLDRMQTTLREAQELIAAVQSHVQTCIAKSHEMDFSGKVTRMRLDENIRFYNCYKRYVRCEGEVKFRKEQRLENVRRMSRNVGFLVKHATESLDPMLPTYREQQKTLAASEAALVAATEQHIEALKAQELLWSPIGDDMDDCDIDYEAPELIAQQLHMELLQAVVESVDEATAKEQRALDQDKMQLRKMHNRVVATKGAIEDRRTTKHSAAHTNSSSSPVPASTSATGDGETSLSAGATMSPPKASPIKRDH